MATTTETIQVATVVPIDMARDIRELAERNERSAAAEIRLALRAWLDADRQAS